MNGFLMPSLLIFQEHFDHSVDFAKLILLSKHGILISLLIIKTFIYNINLSVNKYARSLTLQMSQNMKMLQI